MRNKKIAELLNMFNNTPGEYGPADCFKKQSKTEKPEKKAKVKKS